MNNRVKIILIISNIIFMAATLILVDRCDYLSKIWNLFQSVEYSSKEQIDNSYCINARDTIEYKQHNYRWVKINCDAEFAPRDGAGALVYKDSLWLIGGWNPNDKEKFPLICNNEVWNSANGEKWNLVKENTFLDNSFNPRQDWEGRHTAGYVVFKDKMWIVGGDANQGHYQSDVWNSENGKTWYLVTDSVPWGPRVLHYTVVFENKIWVIGGQTLPQFANAEEIFYNDIWNSEDGIHWTKVNAEKSKFLARGTISGSAVFNDRIWIIGGSTYDTPDHTVRKLYNDVWSSKDGVNWECHTQQAEWEIRCYHSVAVWDNKLWVLDGSYCNQVRGIGNTNDVWFSENGEKWTELPDAPWKPRHASSVFVMDNCLYMVAGNNMESDVWKLEKINNVW